MDQDVGDGADTTLTGSDALRFLCFNFGVDRKQPCVLTKSNVFSRLYASAVQAGEVTMTSSSESPAVPSTSLLCSPRKKRKSYKPSRVPPLEEEPVRHPRSARTDSPLSFTTMSNRPTAHADDSSIKRKSAISGKCFSAMKDCHDNVLSTTQTVKGKCSKKPDQRSDSTVVCKNLACKAILSSKAPFCRRCSCCICKEFDDNKDPSLWITCDADEQDGCGLSCHMECALKDKVAGVTKTGSAMLLDGGFFCRSCGKVHSIIGLWKKQLIVAKNARRVDVLCHRLSLSHSLLEGTSKYKDAHALIDEAKKKLDVEVGLMTKCSAKLERCIVNRLSCNPEVQGLIDRALERAGSSCDVNPSTVDAENTATCKKDFCTIQFEDACSSSVVVVAVDNHPCDDRLSYKLWHRKASDLCYPDTPTDTIQGTSRKVLVSGLKPHTVYAFKIAPSGDGEACEAECCTKSVEQALIENPVDDGVSHFMCDHGKGETDDAPNQLNSIFKTMKGREKGIRGGAAEDSSPVKTSSLSEVYDAKGNNLVEEMGDVGTGTTVANEERESLERDAREITELVRVSDPEEELNNPKQVDLGLPNGREHSPPSMVMAAHTEIAGNGNAVSQSLAMQPLHQSVQGSKLMVALTGMDGPAPKHPGVDVHSLEFSIRVIRWLEREGHLNKEFRVKFLTWYSLRASDHEKRVVSVFIDTLQDSATSLAAQLMDTFEDVIDAKRQRMTEIGYYRRRYK